MAGVIGMGTAVAGGDHQATTLGHGITSIRRKIRKTGLELRWISDAWPYAPDKLQRDLDALPCRV